MQDIVATTRGGYRVEARAGEHVTVMDEPVDLYVIRPEAVMATE
jgi:hypothetical protein